MPKNSSAGNTPEIISLSGDVTKKGVLPTPIRSPSRLVTPPVTSDLGDQDIPHLLGLGIEFQGQGPVIGLHRLLEPSQVL